MTDRELMQMAFQDIKNSIGITKDEWKPRADIMCNLLRDRLAQPKPEPVFYVIQATDRFGEGYEQTYWGDPNGFPVYAAPPKREWVGLEEEEILKCFDSVALGQVEGACVIDKHVNIFNAIRAIEAKLKEKNT